MKNDLRNNSLKKKPINMSLDTKKKPVKLGYLYGGVHALNI